MRMKRGEKEGEDGEREVTGEQEVEIEGATIEGKGWFVEDIGGVEVAITEVGGRVGSIEGVDAGILEDVAVIGDGLEEDGGEGVVGRVEANVGGRGGRGQSETKREGSDGVAEVRKGGEVVEGREGGDEVMRGGDLDEGLVEAGAGDSMGGAGDKGGREGEGTCKGWGGEGTREVGEGMVDGEGE